MGTKKYIFPNDLHELKSTVLKAIEPIGYISDTTLADKNFLFNAERTKAGSLLPKYYLCYFLLVDLLGFNNLGQSEKISWSIPIDYQGVAFLIEYRKMGLGVFARDAISQEKEAEEIVRLICKAVKMVVPYFEWRALEAAKQPQLNVPNHQYDLFERLKYFLELYKKISKEASERSEEKIVERHRHGSTISFPSLKLSKQAKWLALSALDAFFSWTEHVFIHLSILNGVVFTGESVADLADNDWDVKFKTAISIDSNGTRLFYDQFLVIKRQLRNYVAHGAFGKKGEAFSFHSETGAVPLLLPHRKGSGRFSFSSDLDFDEKEVVELIEKFITHLWSDEREPARIYIESGLPLILTMAKDGSYCSAMKSVETMEVFVKYWSYEFDRAANMDW